MRFLKQSFSFLKRCLLIISLSLILLGCSEESGVFYVGETFSASELSASFTEKAENTDGIFYWAESGEVWHKDKDCGTLSRSKNIFSGTEEEAAAEGKLRACQKCT